MDCYKPHQTTMAILMRIPYEVDNHNDVTTYLGLWSAWTLPRVSLRMPRKARVQGACVQQQDKCTISNVTLLHTSCKGQGWVQLRWGERMSSSRGYESFKYTLRQ
jgi:hypothetical protein